MNPVLNWRYGDVWSFVRGLSLPYPDLYDRGYTSLGGLRNTFPNRALRCINPTNVGIATSTLALIVI